MCFRTRRDSPLFKKRCDHRAGVSLTELLCVLAILSVLLGMYAWSIAQTFVKIGAFIQSLR